LDSRVRGIEPHVFAANGSQAVTEPSFIHETDVPAMLAKAGGFALRIQTARCIEAMALSDGLRLRRPRWYRRKPDSRLVYQYLANRGACDGVVPPEVLYGVVHEVSGEPA
jgi:hypothetical protein